MVTFLGMVTYVTVREKWLLICTKKATSSENGKCCLYSLSCFYSIIVSSAICFVLFHVSYIMILYFVKTVIFKNHDIDMWWLVSKQVLCTLFLLVTGFLTYVKIRRKEFGIMSERIGCIQL